MRAGFPFLLKRNTAMKNKVFFLLLSVLLLWPAFLPATTPPNDNDHNYVTYDALPPLRVSGRQGVSAPFAGMSGQTLLVAGGCNFPGVAATGGGAKQYYGNVFAYDNPSSDEGTWRVVGASRML